jgi:regulator of sirC expression with transglutaminase-like and TPR domain
LLQAIESPSLDQRFRVERLVQDIQQEALRTGFRAVMTVEQDMDIRLEAGMCLIARILDPMAEEKPIRDQLDAMAEQLRKRLAPAKLDQVPPETFVRALIQVLKVEQGLKGNVDDYDNPDNSSLKHVLDTRKGLPIVLSHIAILVAQRLDVPIVGLGVPGRYMIKYAGTDLIINPFDDWQVLTPDELMKSIRGLDPEKYLQADTHRNALSRMLRNLISDYAGRGQTAKAAELRAYLMLVDLPTAP